MLKNDSVNTLSIGGRLSYITRGMGRACGTCGEKGRFIQGLGGEILGERDQLEDLFGR